MVCLAFGYDSFAHKRGRWKQTNGQNRTTGETGSTCHGLSLMALPIISNLAPITSFPYWNKDGQKI